MALTLSTPSRTRHVESLTETIEQKLEHLIAEDRSPAVLYEPVRYVLHSGGKRIRPLFVLLSGELFGVDTDEAMPAALAVEVFHNFTLVHDDIMDQSAERRGRPTVHDAWDVSTAILSGDLLLAQAYQLLVDLPTACLRAVMNLFHRTMERLCEGQALDKAYEKRPTVTVDEYLNMIDRKTGALFQASLELGPLLASADEEFRRLMREVGFHTGRAFQIQDDLLDLTATDEDWGKSIGEDLVEGKKTYLLLRALDAAEGEMLEWFQSIVNRGGLSADRISEARDRFDQLGLVEQTRQQVLFHYRRALDILSNVSSEHSVELLEEVIESMRSRVR